METSREEGELSDDGEITDNSQEWEQLEDVTGAATNLEKKNESKSGKGRLSVSHTQLDRRARGVENVYFSKFNKINENSSYEKRGEGHFRAGPHTDVDYRSGAVSRERESFRNRDSGPGGRHERDESNYRGINDYRSMGPARTVLRTRIPPPPGPRQGSSFWDRQRSLRIARSYGSMGRRPAAPILSESTRDHQYVDRQPRHFNRNQVPPRKLPFKGRDHVRHPKQDSDSDFDEILKKYKQIQEQLETLKREEENAAKILENDIEVEEKVDKPEAVPRQEVIPEVRGEDDLKDVEKKTSTVSGTASDLEKCHIIDLTKDSPDSPEPQQDINVIENKENTEQSTEDDADLDELNLRLIALASVATKAKDKKAKADEVEKSKSRPEPKGKSEAKRSRSKEKVEPKKISPQSRRRQSRVQVRREAERKKRRVEVERKVSREARPRQERSKERSVREREYRATSSKERGAERERPQEEQQRRTAHHILLLDDPEEQYEKFLEWTTRDSSSAAGPAGKISNRKKNKSPDVRDPGGMFEGIDLGLFVNSPVPPPPEEVHDLPGLYDNYKVEEMDLDSASSCSSPALEEMELDLPYDAEYDPTQPVVVPTEELLSHLREAEEVLRETTEEMSSLRHPKQSDEPEDNDESDEMMLRAQLLASLAERRRKRIDEESKSREETPPLAEVFEDPSGYQDSGSPAARVPSPLLLEAVLPVQPRTASPLSVPARKHKAVPARKLAPLTMPVHERVVINLEEDTSDSEEDDDSYHKGGGLLDGLDMLLKQGRMAAEEAQLKAEKSVKSPTTPEGLRSMPQVKIAEYKKLKAEIKKREAGTSSSSSLGKKRTVMAKKQEVVIEKSKERIAVEEKVAAKEKELEKQRGDLYKGQLRLQLLRTHHNKRRSHFNSTEAKVARLREQLAAAEKICKASELQMEMLGKQLEVVESIVHQKMENVSKFEKEVVAVGKKVYGDTYQPRCNAQDQMAAKPSLTVTIPNDKVNSSQRGAKILAPKQKMTPAFIAQEKERLLQLQEEYAKKIKQLKAKSNKRTVKKKAPSKVVLDAVVKQPVVKPALESLDKITLSTGSDTVQEETDQQPRTMKKRRSLIELDPSTKPHLPVASAVSSDVPGSESAVTTGRSGGDGQRQAGQGPTDLSQVELPSKQQCHNLAKLLRERQEDSDHSANMAPYTTGSLYDLLGKFQPPVLKLKDVSVSSTQLTQGQQTNEVLTSSPLKPYSSPLLRFKSYRFSPYFRNRARLKLSSRTYSNKIDNKRIFCNFDLTGKCNDQQCPWQHSDSYVFADVELLQDVLAYCPDIAGAQENLPVEKITAALEKYLSVFLSANKQLTLDEQCVLLVSSINKHAKHVVPHTFFYAERSWKPQQAEKPQENAPKPKSSLCGALKVPELKNQKLDIEYDDIVGEGDVRYFMLDTTEVHDLETAVLDHPNDVPQWIRLAYRKLHQPRSDAETNLDHALNALARGIEANRSSSLLWQHYLSLYRRRGSATVGYLRLCQQASLNAPSYQIYWQLLSHTSGVQERTVVYEKMVDYLLQQEDNPALISHQLLEALLNQSCLLVLCGRQKAAQQLFLTSLTESMCAKLSIKDACLAWLCYIYLVEFHSLPPSIQDPSNNNPSRLVSKEPFLFPWLAGAGTRTPSKSLLSLFARALSACSDSQASIDTNVLRSLPIYRNLVLLELARGKPDCAKLVCQRLLQSSPAILDIHLCLALLERDQGNPAEAVQVLEKAVAHLPFAPQLYSALASHYLKQSDQDTALHWLETAVVSLFDVEIHDSKKCDPNLLYCVILGQTLPLSYTPPALKDSVTKQQLKEGQTYWWINYCLLLELQGESGQAIEAYETALSTALTAKDSQKIWLRYLRHVMVLVEQSPRKQAQMRLLTKLTMRCLTSSPVKESLPENPNLHWSDYSFHNQVVDLYIGTLPDTEHLPAYNMFLALMPSNVPLALRACTSIVDKTAARSICRTSLYDQPACILLWKRAIALSMEAENYKEVYKLYSQATQVLPYSLTLWKDFVLFELTQGSGSEGVKQKLEKCQQLGLDMADFIKTVCR